jgi:hypothetical protein
MERIKVIVKLKNSDVGTSASSHVMIVMIVADEQETDLEKGWKREL